MANTHGKIINVLICDDEVDKAKRLKQTLEKAWLDSRAPERFNAEVFCEIVEAGVGGPGLRLEELGRFDLVLMDILWRREEKDVGTAKGLDYCSVLRANFPELPIIILSGHIKVGDFGRLAELRVDWIVSKRALRFDHLVSNIRAILERSSLDAKGRPLFMQLRATTNLADAWQPALINAAASEFWSSDSAYGKWTGFWDTWDQYLTSKRLFLPIESIRRQFEETDLLNLGIMPGMRGHLEHVIFVYFTGYVVTNRLPEFKEAVKGAMQNLLGSAYNEACWIEYWDAFQLAWLACATLHDTAYCLEVLPDGIARLADIARRCGFARFDQTLAVISADGVNTSAPGMPQALGALEQVFTRLYGAEHRTWVQDHLEFQAKGNGKRFNHGVLGALQFLIELQKEVEADRVNPTIQLALQWAALAMAMHSLKKPGSEDRVGISFQKDPLSFLLMVCDEIQVWNRERPDIILGRSCYRTCDLTLLECREKTVYAEVTFMHSKRFAGDPKDTLAKISKKITEDERMLKLYLAPDPLNIQIEFRVAASEPAIGEIRIGNRV